MASVAVFGRSRLELTFASRRQWEAGRDKRARCKGGGQTIPLFWDILSGNPVALKLGTLKERYPKALRTHIVRYLAPRRPYYIGLLGYFEP